MLLNETNRHTDAASASIPNFANADSRTNTASLCLISARLSSCKPVGGADGRSVAMTRWQQGRQGGNKPHHKPACERGTWYGSSAGAGQESEAPSRGSNLDCQWYLRFTGELARCVVAWHIPWFLPDCPALGILPPSLPTFRPTRARCQAVVHNGNCSVQRQGACKQNHCLTLERRAACNQSR